MDDRDGWNVCANLFAGSIELFVIGSINDKAIQWRNEFNEMSIDAWQ